MDMPRMRIFRKNGVRLHIERNDLGLVYSCVLVTHVDSDATKVERLGMFESSIHANNRIEREVTRLKKSGWEEVS
jgi:hypothetical protein